jgi:hypothetical protein
MAMPLSFVYLRVDSNQNNETGKPATDDIAANEQNISADTPPPASLEDQSPLPETAQHKHNHQWKYGFSPCLLS